jgi:S-formylglutathione hydrolase FrmB
MPYFIYLPPGYESEGRRYPVLYMLHGNSGSYEEWAAYGLIDRADRMITLREILPLIIVLPQGDFSYWVNHAYDGPRYGDYVSTDLVRHINATYRVLPGAEHRAIGGLSMGGTGALLNAFRNPNVFSIVGAHSPALPEDDGIREFLGMGREFRQRDPITLATRRGGLDALAIWIDVGDEDPWLERADLLHDILQLRGIPHEWQVLPGEHWGGYWSEHIVDYLRFYDRALNPDRGF